MSRSDRLILYACFIVSGAAGLAYETIWMRLLSLQFGSTTLAASSCLAGYLGGLALGAAAGGRLGRQLRNPALAYAVIEGLVALFGLLSPVAIDAAAEVQLAVQSMLGLTPALTGLLQSALVFLALLPPTVLMGATLPLLVYSVGSASGSHVTAGRLYAANTLGAVAGVLLTGLVILPALGVTGGLRLAVATNVLLAIVVALRFREASVASSDVQPATPAAGARMAWAAAAAGGFISLLSEVVWTRALELVVGNSTRAFALMLGVFLLGLTLGAALAARLVSRGLSARALLVAAQTGAGLGACLVMVMLPLLPRWFVAAFAAWHEHPWLFALAEIGMCAATLLLPAICLGLVFPLTVAIAGANARAVGSLYAVNTAAAIVGAWTAGLLLVPRLGIGATLTIAGAACFAVATIVQLATPQGRSKRLAIAPAAIGLAAILLTPAWNERLMSSGVSFHAPAIARVGFDRFMTALAELNVAYYQEGPTATVSVLERGDNRVLRIDGRTEGSNQAIAQVLLGHLPFLTRPDTKDVFVIGLGTGTTAGVVSSKTSLRSLTVAELEPAMRGATAHFTSINRDPFADPRVRLVNADARSMLRTSTAASLDAIISQPSFPWMPGSSKLFTREFYQLAAARLRPQGVFVQWVQLYNLEFEDLICLLRTIADAFPHVLVMEVGRQSGELALIAGREPVTLSWEAAQALFRDGEAARELARVGIPSAGALASRVLFDARGIAALSPGADPSLNTDRNARLEFASLTSLYKDTTRTNLARVRELSTDPLALVAGIDSNGRQTALVELARVSLRSAALGRGLAFARQAAGLAPNVEALRTLGDLAYASRQTAEGVAAWERAVTIDATDLQTLRRLLRHYRLQPPERRPSSFAEWTRALPDGAALPPDPYAAGGDDSLLPTAPIELIPSGSIPPS